MKDFPIIQIRKETKAVDQSLFFNSAGSSLPSDESIRIIKDYIDNEASIGGYGLMEKEYDSFQEFYNQVAILINAKPTNIAFAQSATIACSQALYAIDWNKNDVILTSKLEYASNHLSLLRIKERFDIKIILVDVQDDGLIDMNALEKEMKTHHPKALMLTHIPTNTGVIQDVFIAGQLCKQYNCIYILDACQSVGQIDVDVQKINCDFLSVTGRKFLRGPRGTGFLYVSDEILEDNKAPLCIDLAGADWTGHNQYRFHNNAKRFEMWEKNYSILLGLTQSIREINKIGIKKVDLYNKDLQSFYRQTLQSIDGVNIADEGDNTCNIITWTYKDISRSKSIELLNACNVVYSMAMKESALIDMNRKGIDWSIRFSPHYFNTKEEIEVFRNRFLDKLS